MRKKKRKVKSNLIPLKKQLNYFLRTLPELRVWRNHWKEQYGNKCAITASKRKMLIHIHHSSKTFHDIRNETLSDLHLPFYYSTDEYTKEELALVADLFVAKHCQAEGIPLLKSIHKLFHTLYGYNTTLEDFHEFKKRWDSGEFPKGKR